MQVQCSLYVGEYAFLSAKGVIVSISFTRDGLQTAFIPVSVNWLAVGEKKYDEGQAIQHGKYDRAEDGVSPPLGDGASNKATIEEED